MRVRCTPTPQVSKHLTESLAGVLTGVWTAGTVLYMNTTPAAKSHTITCNGPALARGVRMERTWTCTCGWTANGYDTAVRKAFAQHKREA